MRNIYKLMISWSSKTKNYSTTKICKAQDSFCKIMLELKIVKNKQREQIFKTKEGTAFCKLKEPEIVYTPIK